MARIEGTGIKEPSKEAKVANLKFLRNPKKFLQEKVDQKLDSMTKEGKTPFGTSIGGSAVGEEGLGRFGNQNELSDASTTRFGNQFSPSVEVASADLSNLNFGNTFTKQAESNLADSSTGEAESLSEPGSEEFKQEVKQYEQKVKDSYIPGNLDKFGTDERGQLTEEGQKNLEDSYKIYRDFNYDRNPLKYRQGVDFSKKEKSSFGERISNLAGNVFNTITGTSSAQASQIGGSIPQNNVDTTGDTSFRSFRMSGAGILGPGNAYSTGVKKEKSDTPFADGGQGVNLPSDYKATEEAAFNEADKFIASRENKGAVDSSFSSYVRGAGDGQERGNTGLAEARQIAKRNPNVSINEKTGRAEATNDTGRAKAQAMAVNRKIQGKSISQTKADNKAAVRKSAAERQAAFKKTGKSTVGARRAAAKASVKAAAKKRHAAFKKRRAAKKKKKCDILLKYNISPLTNMNLIRDDLAEVAYFVKEIQEK